MQDYLGSFQIPCKLWILRGMKLACIVLVNINTYCLADWIGVVTLLENFLNIA